MKELRTLYPEIPANFTKMMKVDDTHTIYYEESGNPDGIPVIFLHVDQDVGQHHRADVILIQERIELFCLINVEVENLHHMLV